MDLHTSKYHNKLKKFYLKYTDYLYALLKSISGTTSLKKKNRPEVVHSSRIDTLHCGNPLLGTTT